MTKMTFNKQNIGMKDSVESKLLDEYREDLDKAKELVAVMERRYLDLYEEMYCGYEVPQALRHRVAIMREEMED